MIRSFLVVMALCICASLQAQISTTYSLRHHAITFKSDRAEIVVDPAITFKYLSSDSYSGVDNIRGATFTAKIDSNFTAGGALFERQSTLSPFLSECVVQTASMPGWGRFKRLDGLTWGENPRTIDIARAIGFLAWTQTSFKAKIEIGAPRFGWSKSPLMLSQEDVPYPSVKFGWGKSDYFVDVSMNQWVGSMKDGTVFSEYIVRNTNKAIISSAGFSNEHCAVALLFGHTIEPSISVVSMAGRFVKKRGFINYEAATSSTSTSGPSYQIGAGYNGDQFRTGLYLTRTKDGLYGDGEEMVWSNAGIPLGVITGNNTKMSSVYFTFKNCDSAKWYFNWEVGTFSNAQYNSNDNLNDDFSRFTKGSITRIFSQDWDMGLTLSVEAFKGHDPMLGIGVVHGIVRGYEELLIP
ncbi:MAG: hypothetical protein HN563_04375 [Flavobacteriales bacterium]|nr:hypothetical protein [Flavobacteriales bacterium]